MKVNFHFFILLGVKFEPKKNENPLTVSTAKTLLDKLIEEKPELKNVRKEFKIKVLKKVIAFIEKASKSLKPGNYIYCQKLLNISNKPAIKIKFFEILKNENFDFIGIDMNILLLMIGEILNSSAEMNINPSLLRMKEFNENLLESEMNPESYEIFVLIKFKILDTCMRAYEENDSGKKGNLTHFN